MEKVDFSTFSTLDVADIGLQRTRHLAKWPLLGCPSYKAWVKGDPKPLHREAQRRRDFILKGAMGDVEEEFSKVVAYLGNRRIDRLVDIGCGHALIDLLFWRKYGCRIHLVDIERTETTHHEYEKEGAGYASLEAARRFLTVNGVPAASIRTTNPTRTGGKVEDREVDLIISMISAGFHYPISTYTGFALSSLKTGGILMFDARDGTNQEAALTGFSEVEVVDRGQKHSRLAAIKG